MEPKTFSTYWDTQCKVITGFTVFIFLLIPILMTTPLTITQRVDKIFPIVLASVVVFELMTLLITYCLAPLRYTVQQHEIVIQRVCSSLRIPADQIDTVSKTHSQTIFHKSIRIGASGGLFGYFGTYHAPFLGTFSVYAKHIEGDLVVIKRKSGIPIVLAPDEIDAFIETISLPTSQQPGG